MKDTEREELINAALTDCGPAEPPPAFASSIMRRVRAASAALPWWRQWERAWQARRLTNFVRARGVISSRTPARELPQKSKPSWQGGEPVAKKMMWGFVGIAAIAIVVMWFTGFPPINKGAEGTIGAAKRYQAQQMSGKDVVLGDTDAQAFLQSDTFDRLLKDPAALKLLSQASMRQALANQSFAALMKDAAAQQALSKAEVRAAINSPEFRLAVQNAGMREAVNDKAVRLAISQYAAALAEASSRQAFQDANVRALLANRAAFEPFVAQLVAMRAQAEQLARASQAGAREARGGYTAAMIDAAALRAKVQDAQALAAMRSDSFKAMLASARMAAMVGDAQARAALANRAFCEAMANAQVQAAVSQAALAAVLAREDVAQMMQAQAFASAVADSAFAAAIANSQVAAVLSSREFGAAMQAQAMVSALAARGFASAVASQAFANRVAAAAEARPEQ